MKAIRKPGTLVVMSEACRGKLEGTVMTNGQASVFLDVPVESVPAYNLASAKQGDRAAPLRIAMKTAWQPFLLFLIASFAVIKLAFGFPPC